MSKLVEIASRFLQSVVVFYAQLIPKPERNSLTKMAAKEKQKEGKIWCNASHIFIVKKKMAVKMRNGCHSGSRV